MSNHYQDIVSDLNELGYNFRLIELDDSLHVHTAGQWQLMTDTLADVIDVDMYELGYGRKRKPGLQIVKKAYRKLGYEQRLHPIKDYFEKLPFYMPCTDGYVMIKNLARHFTNPDGMFSTWLFRWMVGAIAKVYEQARNPMLVISGPQDMGKSTFARWLCPFPDNFMKQGINPDDKDSEIRLSDTFIWEVDELPNTTTRQNSEALKSFLTLPFIKRRAAYGHYLTYKPAITSFMGTANWDGAGFLNDPTGTTRFLTCEVTQIDFSYDKLDRDLLWSEAYWYYRNVPKSWELSPSEKVARDEINSRYEITPPLVDAILHRCEVTQAPGDVMSAFEIKNWLSGWYRIGNEQGFYNELGRALRKLGLEKRRAVYQKDQQHHWEWVGIKKRIDVPEDKNANLF